MSDERRRATLTITGEFTDGELAAFVALVRHIDNHNPEGHYGVLIDDPDRKLEELEEVMRNRLMPEVPGRTTPTISVHRKQ